MATTIEMIVAFRSSETIIARECIRISEPDLAASPLDRTGGSNCFVEASRVREYSVSNRFDDYHAVEDNNSSNTRFKDSAIRLVRWKKKIRKKRKNEMEWKCES